MHSRSGMTLTSTRSLQSLEEEKEGPICVWTYILSFQFPFLGPWLGSRERKNFYMYVCAIDTHPCRKNFRGTVTPLDRMVSKLCTEYNPWAIGDGWDPFFIYLAMCWVCMHMYAFACSPSMYRIGQGPGFFVRPRGCYLLG